MGLRVLHVLPDLRLRGVAVMVVVVVCFLVTVNCQQTASGDLHAQSSMLQTNNRHRRTSQDLSDATMYMHYTPTTPAPHNIDCYVEIRTTVRQGGRCIQLGPRRRGLGSRLRPWACQAGLHLAFSPDCANPRSRARRPYRRG